MKKRIRIFAGAAGFAALCLVGAAALLASRLPDRLSFVEGQALTVNAPVRLDVVGDRPAAVQASETLRAGGQFTASLRLFHIVPVKTVTVSIVRETDVIPCGATFGVKLYTAGVVVVGMTDVDTADGGHNPAYDAGIRPGDVILAINGRPVSSNDDVASIVAGCGGKPLTFSLKRGSVGFQARFTPLKSISAGEYKAGMWVRDSTAGIGTITFYSPQTGVFGALGHGICDVDTGKIMPLLAGDVVKVHIAGIVRGAKGQPGEIQGTLDDDAWGSLSMNTETGVFGSLSIPETGKAVPVAMPQEIQAGPAKILATLDDSGPKAYDISIEKINWNDAPTKNMVIRVTDPALLSKTGGIVQGMSGCPILQNGRLVGAVTHVFVNDPQLGYGIFAENMLNTAKTLENFTQKDVS